MTDELSMNPILANLVVVYFLKGGPIMWPILVALLAALTVFIERALWWLSLRRRTRTDLLNESFDAITAGDFDAALRLTANSVNPFRRTIHDDLLHASSAL